MGFSPQSNNLGGWAEVGQFLAEQGKRGFEFSVDYCKKNPEKCLEAGTNVYKGATGTPLQVPSFFGGLDKSKAGQYTVTNTSALNLRTAPAISDNIIARLAGGQMVISKGTASLHPKWHFVSIPGQNLEGWASAGSTGSYLSRYVPPSQRAVLAPGEKHLTMEEFYQQEPWKKSKIGLGTLAAGAVAAYFLLK